MSAMASAWLGSVVAASITGWLGYMFGTRQERERERRARVLVAAAELTARLRELQRLLRSFGRVEVDSDEVTTAVLRWSKAYDGRGHRLPPEWQHVAGSVRAAVGTVFNGAAFIHIRPDTATGDLGHPDGLWQDFADDYIDYVARCLLDWGDSSRATSRALLSYDEWLVQTGRQET